MGSEFKARLAARVQATSALGTVVVLGEAALMLTLATHVPAQVAPIFLGVGASLLALFAGVALTAIRGYDLAGGTLRVARPFWSTSHSLAGLKGAARDPNALLGFTLRGFGNNGFFALNGWRRVEPYGWCRVLATDPENAVVLCAAERTYIVTPDRPDEFVQQALALARPAR
jgi:hypothetical protein